MKDLQDFEKSVGKYRVTRGEMGTTEDDGRNGCFVVPLGNGKRAICICSDEVWDHVSVRVRIGNKERCPYWSEMCRIKDLFFRKDEVCVQYHPKEEDYVNLHQHVLHLFRPQNVEIPTPPKEFV